MELETTDEFLPEGTHAESSELNTGVEGLQSNVFFAPATLWLGYFFYSPADTR